jgi:hypothetical protein
MDLSEALIGGGILPHLHRIFTTLEYECRIRADACAILSDFIKTLSNLNDIHPGECMRYMQEIVDTWMSVLVEGLEGDIQVGVQVVQTLVGICKGSRSVQGMELFEKCVGLMQRYQAQYISEFIDRVTGHEDIDSRGRVVGLEVFMSGVFDLMGCLMGRDDVAGFLRIDENMAGVLGLVMVYTQVGAREVFTWGESVGEVVCEENEASFTFSLRKRALEYVLVCFT